MFLNCLYGKGKIVAAAFLSLLFYLNVGTAAAAECVAHNPVEPPPVPGEVIFQTDFSQDAGYSLSSRGLWALDANSTLPRPAGWDGVIATQNSKISVVTGEGVDGSNALKLEYDPTAAQPRISLAKHLTKDRESGHDELYIRYNIRLPNRFRAGNETNFIPYWKWGRLFQNTPTDGYGWGENRVDSGFVVWAVGGSVPNTKWVSTWAENQGENLHKGSAGGERVSTGYFVSGADPLTQDGYFESMADGEWAISDSPAGALLSQPQRYHTIEFRFKLASSEAAEDGVFEMWWDGVKQGQLTQYGTGNALSGQPRQGIPTLRKGSGWNFFTFFDNMAGWNRGWSASDVDGFIYVNDVVVSTGRIGHDYVANGVTDKTQGSGR